MIYLSFCRLDHRRGAAFNGQVIKGKLVKDSRRVPIDRSEGKRLDQGS